jgi:hypothetical protein
MLRRGAKLNAARVERAGCLHFGASEYTVTRDRNSSVVQHSLLPAHANTIAVSNEVGPLLVDRTERYGINSIPPLRPSPLVIRFIRKRVLA